MSLIKHLMEIRKLSWPRGLAMLALLYLWGVTIVHLSVPWANNPQYSYGWAVPFLCAFLLVRRWQQGAISSKLRAPSSALRALSFLLFVVLAFLYLPTRLIQAANPDWRLVGWALAVEAVGLTLYFLGLAVCGSRFAVRDFVFPIGFFLVAVPWPTVVEGTIVQSLMRLDTSATCELVGWLGIPAMPHGNVIEVATGVVGIDEACSGIRSFQATLMISLFVGEYYALGMRRRLVCVATGFLLAILLNLVRQTVLVWVAAHQGVPAIAQWHDPTGVIILLGCFLALWGMGVWLAPGKAKSEVRSRKSEAGGEHSTFNIQHSTSNAGAVGRSHGGEHATANNQLSTPHPAAPERSEGGSALRLPPSALALIGWILLVEAGVNGWYAWRKSQSPPNLSWQLVCPTNAPAYTTIPFPEATRKLLRFDTGIHAAWEAEDGRRAEAFYLRWNPGRTAGYLAKLHTPQACLPSIGLKLVAGPERIVLSARTRTLPFQSYAFAAQQRRLDVFYCHWPDRGVPGRSLVGQSSWTDRFRNVWEGRGTSGQRVLEIVLWDYPNAAAAQTAGQKLLEKIIAREP